MTLWLWRCAAKDEGGKSPILMSGCDMVINGHYFMDQAIPDTEMNFILPREGRGELGERRESGTGTGMVEEKKKKQSRVTGY